MEVLNEIQENLITIACAQNDMFQCSLKAEFLDVIEDNVVGVYPIKQVIQTLNSYVP